MCSRITGRAAEARFVAKRQEIANWHLCNFNFYYFNFLKIILFVWGFYDNTRKEMLSGTYRETLRVRARQQLPFHQEGKAYHRVKPAHKKRIRDGERQGTDSAVGFLDPAISSIYTH